MGIVINPKLHEKIKPFVNFFVILFTTAFFYAYIKSYVPVNKEFVRLLNEALLVSFFITAGMGIMDFFFRKNKK